MPALMPMPRFPKFKRMPGSSFRERWNRMAISGIVLANEKPRAEETRGAGSEAGGGGDYAAAAALTALGYLALKILAASTMQSKFLRNSSRSLAALSGMSGRT